MSVNCQMSAWKRSFDKWTLEETAVLIDAWAPLYRRRRSGAKDAWVPLRIPGRALSSRALVTEDWRAVAFAVNSYRTTTAGLDSCRTYLQCKQRMAHLRRQYVKGLAPRLGWPFYGVLHAVWAADDEVGDRCAGAAAADEGGSVAAVVDGSGPSGDDRGIAMVAAARASAAAAAAAAGDGDAIISRGSAMEAPADVIEGAAAAADVGRGGAASVDARGGAFVVHEDRRAAPAAVAINPRRTSDDGTTSSERTHKQKQCSSGRVKLLSCIYEKKADVVVSGSGAAVDEEERGGVGDATAGGASVDESGAAGAEAARLRASFVPPPIPKRPRSSANPTALSSANTAAVGDGGLSAQALATVSVDGAVLTKFAEIYKELRMKVLDVEREKAAAAHAGAGTGSRA